MFELPSKDGNITPEKVRKSRIANAVSRQNSVCLGSSLSMRSLAIDEPCSQARALYATLVSGSFFVPLLVHSVLVCICLYLCVSACACMYTCAYLYVFVYLCICLCMCLWVSFNVCL